MDIKKIYAKNSREGIRKVKEMLGDEAIILKTKTKADGVELYASADFDEKNLLSYTNTEQYYPSVNQFADKVSEEFNDPYQQNQQASNLQKHHVSKMQRVTPQFDYPGSYPENFNSETIQINNLIKQQLPAINAVKTDISNLKKVLYLQVKQNNNICSENSVASSQLKQLRKELKVLQQAVHSQVRKSQLPVIHSLKQEISELKKTVALQVRQQHKPVLNKVHNEITTLRDSLQNQFEIAGWSRWSQNNPIRAAMLERLSRIGLNQNVCRRIVSRVDGKLDTKTAWRQTLGLWAKELELNHDSILKYGGRIALVGSTGVGKTTTIAKLASQFVSRHGVNSVALVSCDHYRVGAHDQLMTYGRLIGIPVVTAMHRNELNEILNSLKHKKLVLIDTAGMSQHSSGFKEHLKELSNFDFNIDHYLTISGNTQYDVLKNNIAAHQSLKIKGAIITKVDESVNYGEVLSAVIELNLPLAYLTTGQSVPDDIESAKISHLISRAVALSAAVPGEEKMALQYGRLVANL